jgi:hypothetical protein
VRLKFAGFSPNRFQLHVAAPDNREQVGITDLGATIPYSAAREEGFATDVVPGIMKLDYGS